ncbi:DUF3833 family protein [Roseomonas sp. CCTCC AB2023176]|uniref:DUF3833 family protein n=1 Tax=Roseomonas sp. CCTCC AB2023176 TaxID=3342640 RepID=UPI0035D63747
MSTRRSLLTAAPALGAAALLPGCGTSPDTFAGKGPPFRPEEFFAARLRSNGLITNFFGAVNGWFTCELIGGWDGTTLTLDEYFVFDDTREERRFWRLRRDPSAAGGNGWAGEATDATGAIAGTTSGNALNLKYELNQQQLDGSRRKLGYDQWFVRLNEETALSRANISWYGIGVATAQVSFRRLGPGGGTSVYAGQAYEEARRAARPAADTSAPAQPGRPEPGRSVIAPRR